MTITVLKPLRQYPFVIVRDTREQCPLTFSPSARVVRDTLEVGDYSVRGLEDQVALERKSMDDLINSITHDRARFRRELKALRRWRLAILLVEANWQDLIRGAYRSRMNTDSAVASVLSFVLSYGVLPVFAGDHATASVLAEKILYLFAKRIFDQHKKLVKSTRRGPGEGEDQ